jgi:hypothetical protein
MSNKYIWIFLCVKKCKSSLFIWIKWDKCNELLAQRNNYMYCPSLIWSLSVLWLSRSSMSNIRSVFVLICFLLLAQKSNLEKLSIYLDKFFHNFYLFWLRASELTWRLLDLLVGTARMVVGPNKKMCVYGHMSKKSRVGRH